MTQLRNVLVVEDLVAVGDYIVRALDESICPVRTDRCATLRDASNQIESSAYDLALVDLGLPDGDGTELILALKQMQPDCRCIVTTIFDDSDHLFRALRAGADGYLLKDEPEAVFRERLCGILQGRPALSSSMAQRMLEFFHPTSSAGSGLTPREVEVLVLIARGYSVKRSAEQLGLAYHTVAGYLKVVYQKLQVSSRAEATLKAIDLGLLSR